MELEDARDIYSIALVEHPVYPVKLVLVMQAVEAGVVLFVQEVDHQDRKEEAGRAHDVAQNDGKLVAVSQVALTTPVGLHVKQRVIFVVDKGAEQEFSVNFKVEDCQYLALGSRNLEEIVEDLNPVEAAARREDECQGLGDDVVGDEEEEGAKGVEEDSIFEANGSYLLSRWRFVCPFEVKQLKLFVEKINREGVEPKDLYQHLVVEADLARVVEAESWEVGQVLLATNQSHESLETGGEEVTHAQLHKEDDIQDLPEDVCCFFKSLNFLALCQLRLDRNTQFKMPLP